MLIQFETQHVNGESHWLSADVFTSTDLTTGIEFSRSWEVKCTS